MAKSRHTQEFKHEARQGATRVHRTLQDQGWKVTEKRVSRRMKLMGLVSKAARRYKVTTDSDHNKHASDNLLQHDFNSKKPNEKWVTDISYIPTSEGRNRPIFTRSYWLGNG